MSETADVTMSDEIAPLTQEDTGNTGEESGSVIAAEDEGAASTEGAAAESGKHGKGPSPPGWDKGLGDLSKEIATLRKQLAESKTQDAPAQAQSPRPSAAIAAKLVEIDAVLKDEADAAISPGHRKAIQTLRDTVALLAEQTEAQQATATRFQQGEQNRAAWTSFEQANADIPDAVSKFNDHAKAVQAAYPGLSPKDVSVAATARFDMEAQQIRATAKANKGKPQQQRPNTTGRTGGPQNASRQVKSDDPLEGFTPERLAQIGEEV